MRLLFFFRVRRRLFGPVTLTLHPGVREDLKALNVPVFVNVLVVSCRVLGSLAQLLSLPSRFFSVCVPPSRLC